MRQQFHRGDLVRTLPIDWVTTILPFYGIIIGSYRDQYGGSQESNKHCYSVLQLHDNGTVDHVWSWLEDKSIEYLVEPRSMDNLDFIDNFLENKPGYLES